MKKLDSTKKEGRLLSYILRHNPSKYGLVPDREGYVEFEALLNVSEMVKKGVDRNKLLEIIEGDDKGRFEIRDGFVRARYGHTFEVNMGAWNEAPPKTLYHGTVRSFLESINANGIRAQSRQFVHLATATDVAESVANRHGHDVVILEVDAFSMHYDGYQFYNTKTGTWLVDKVPSKYIINLNSVKEQ